MTKQNKLFAAGLTAGIVAIGAGYVYSQSNSQSQAQSQNQATPTSASSTGNTSTADSKQAVTIAYQTGVDPAKLAQADKTYEQTTQRDINWRKFDTGADVVAAISAGSIDIGNIGSSPLAAAATKGVPLQVFLVTSEIGEAESLVVRNASNIKTPQDLIGKKIAVPYVSTTHYSLLAALKHWNIDPSKVTIINLRPPEINAAWERGDIDATYVWEPVLSKVKATGHVLTTSKEVASWGSPTYDLWVARKDFAQKNPDFLKQFVKISTDATGKYSQDPKAFIGNASNVQKIAQITGSTPSDISTLLAGNRYLPVSEQQTLLQKPFADNIRKTAEFLKSQGKVDTVLADYSDFVTNQYLDSK